MLNSRAGASVVVLALLHLGGGGWLEARPESDFPVPGRGSLRIDVSDDWRVESRSVQSPPSLTLRLVPKTGRAFEADLTAVWLDSGRLKATTAGTTRTDVELMAEGLLSARAESSTGIQRLSGAGVFGWYFVFAIRNPGSGEFEYLTQGSFLTGEVLSQFTIKHHTGSQVDLDRILGAFRDSMHIRLLAPGAVPHEVAGAWRVVKNMAPGISAFGPWAEAWVGRKAEYEPRRAVFGPARCASPRYESQIVDAEEYFLTGFKVRAAAVGITTKTIVVVDVQCNGEHWLEAGSLLVVKPDGRLLTVWDGVFFEMSR
jgi:hypothetical protein